MSEKYDSLYDKSLSDIEDVLKTLESWEEMYPEQDLAFKVNIGILTNKIVNYVSRQLEHECKKGLNAFLWKVGHG